MHELMHFGFLCLHPAAQQLDGLTDLTPKWTLLCLVLQLHSSSYLAFFWKPDISFFILLSQVTNCFLNQLL